MCHLRNKTKESGRGLTWCIEMGQQIIFIGVVHQEKKIMKLCIFNCECVCVRVD